MRRSEAALLAGDLLAQASAFDQTVQAESEVVIRAWTEAIAGTDFTSRELGQAVARVYSAGEDVPRNKVGAILAAARQVRKDTRRAEREALEGAQERALPPVGRFGPPDPGVYQFGHAAPGQYWATPIDVVCGVCGAGRGAQCVAGGQALRKPHFSRVFKAASL